MNHRRYIPLAIKLIVSTLVVAGCATPQATSLSTSQPQVCPTNAPQSCPTNQPQTCPTAQACPTKASEKIIRNEMEQQPSSDEELWLYNLYGASEIEILFEPGEKCTVNAPSVLDSGMHFYTIKVNDQAHTTYAVIFQTLDEGKALEDLQAYPKMATEPPTWDHDFRENYVDPDSLSFYREDFPEGQIYISCFVSTETGILRILDFGPVEIE